MIGVGTKREEDRMDKAKARAYAKTAGERLKEGTDRWLAKSEVIAKLRKNHEATQTMKSPPVAKKA
jgi:hypothetical protein